LRSSLFNIFLNLLLKLVASFCLGQNEQDIIIENPIQKFKKVNEGKLLSFTYYFSNSSNDTLYISEPKVDCSCTTVILPKTSIYPKSKNKMTVTFDTSDKIGYQERVINLSFKNLKTQSKILKKIVFKGKVKATKETKKIYN